MLEISARAAATLIVRLSRLNVSPVAEAAARHATSIKSLFVRSARKAQASVPMRELEGVLIFGGSGAPLYVLEDVLKAWERELLGDGVEAAPTDWIRMRAAAANKNDLPSLLSKALKVGANAANPFDMAFDVANPEAIAWATQHAAQLVTDITTEARAAVRAIVSEAFGEGMAPRETAKLIRATVGLTKRDALAVMRRQLKMLADGVDAAKATARAEKYADKLLRSRAEAIARTEAMRASNEGQLQLWRQAQDKGLLSETARKVWITADPCPICAPMDGETVGINETFSIGFDPPAHTRCKCTVGLVAA